VQEDQIDTEAQKGHWDNVIQIAKDNKNSFKWFETGKKYVTALRQAVTAKQSAVVTALLEAGIKVSIDVQMELLCEAVQANHIEVVEALLKGGFKIIDCAEENPFSICVDSLRLDASRTIFSLLIPHTDKSYFSEPSWHTKFPDNSLSPTPAKLAVALALAESDDCQEIIILAKQRKTVVSLLCKEDDFHYCYALCIAAKAADEKNSKAIEAAKALLEAGAPQICGNDETKNTPLHWAVINGNTLLAKLLLEHGADVSLKNKDKKTPLQLPELFNNIEMIKVFLIKDLIHAKHVDDDSNTLLHWTMKIDDPDMVSILLSRKASLYAKNKNNETPLHFIGPQVARAIFHESCLSGNKDHPERLFTETDVHNLIIYTYHRAKQDLADLKFQALCLEIAEFYCSQFHFATGRDKPHHYINTLTFFIFARKTGQTQSLHAPFRVEPKFILQLIDVLQKHSGNHVILNEIGELYYLIRDTQKAEECWKKSSASCEKAEENLTMLAAKKEISAAVAGMQNFSLTPAPRSSAAENPHISSTSTVYHPG